ncbi:hypothetical protein PYCC9005_002101 [Savitreella phatthalungensis]
MSKPWLDRPRPRTERVARALPALACGIGLLMTIFMGYLGYCDVPKHKYTLKWHDDFDQIDLLDAFTREVSVGGYGVQTFDWTTDYDNNSFIRDGKLHIYPTVTLWPPQQDGSFVNLTAEGRCTVPYTESDCVTRFNSSTAQIINPVQSARLITKGKRELRFGKIEIRAKMPIGEYLWPAVWMMPTDSVYGEWPASGEIDIFEGHGHIPEQPFSFVGSNCVTTSLHWAPVGQETFATFKGGSHLSCWPRTTFAEKYHTFGIEWTPQSIHMYVDSPLYKMNSFDFHGNPFNNALLPLVDGSGAVLDNPWRNSGLKCAPFDQSFYLILNVAVAGTNGWIPDNTIVNAPYSNSRGGQPYQAMRDFWTGKHKWYSSWPQSLDRAMSIDWIKWYTLDNAQYWESLPSARTDRKA